MSKNERKPPPNSLEAALMRLADEAFVHSDAVIVVAVRVSGDNDSNEQIMRCSRGSSMLIGRAMDYLVEFDADNVQIWADDQIADDDDD